jgi:hypothetical protein
VLIESEAVVRPWPVIVMTVPSDRSLTFTDRDAAESLIRFWPFSWAALTSGSIDSRRATKSLL